MKNVWCWFHFSLYTTLILFATNTIFFCTIFITARIEAVIVVKYLTSERARKHTVQLSEKLKNKEKQKSENKAMWKLEASTFYHGNCFFTSFFFLYLYRLAPLFYIYVQSVVITMRFDCIVHNVYTQRDDEGKMRYLRFCRWLVFQFFLLSFACCNCFILLEFLFFLSLCRYSFAQFILVRWFYLLGQSTIFLKIQFTLFDCNSSIVHLAKFRTDKALTYYPLLSPGFHLFNSLLWTNVHNALSSFDSLFFVFVLTIVLVIHRFEKKLFHLFFFLHRLNRSDSIWFDPMATLISSTSLLDLNAISTQEKNEETSVRNKQRKSWASTFVTYTAILLVSIAFVVEIEFSIAHSFSFSSHQK